MTDEQVVDMQPPDDGAAQPVDPDTLGPTVDVVEVVDDVPDVPPPDEVPA